MQYECIDKLPHAAHAPPFHRNAAECPLMMPFVALGGRRPGEDQAAPLDGVRRGERGALARNLGSGFLPLVSSERWDSYLHEDGGRRGKAWIVATEMPRERLALLGLPYDPAQAGEPVRAELLMHRSGDVLAVRFLR